MQMTEEVRRLFVRAIIDGLKGRFTGEQNDWTRHESAQTFITEQGAALKDTESEPEHRAYKHLKNAIAAFDTDRRDDWRRLADTYGFNDDELEELLALPQPI